MNDFDEVRFPEDISFGAVGGPVFNNEVIETLSGNEMRNATQTLAKRRYRINYAMKDKEEKELLLNFFHARNGKSKGFRFKDWSDFTVKKEFLGFYHPDKTLFQFRKTYKSGASKYVRKISKVVKDSVHIYVNDQEIRKGFHICYNTGTLCFVNKMKLGNKIHASFEFDVPVRFDVDYLPIVCEKGDLFSCKDLQLIEII